MGWVVGEVGEFLGGSVRGGRGEKGEGKGGMRDGETNAGTLDGRAGAAEA